MNDVIQLKHLPWYQYQLHMNELASLKMRSILKSTTVVALWLVPAIVKAQPSDNWKNHTDSLYTISYPETWVLNNSLQPLAKLFVFSDQEGKDDRFRENVNLIIQQLPESSIDLDKFVLATETEVRDLITNSVIITNERSRNANGEFQHMVYTGDQGEFKLQFEQYYWVKNGEAIVLTFTAEQSKYGKYQATAKEILDSFRLK